MAKQARRLLVQARRKIRTTHWRPLGLIGMMLLSAGILLVAVLAWQLPYGNSLLLDAGEVAPFSVVAPRRMTYESGVRTEQARDRAAQSVQDQYDVEEMSVRRRQLTRARTALDYITAIRADTNATLAEQSDQLLAIEDIGISVEVAVQILSLDAAEWQSVVREVPLALDRVMRDEIRESNRSLAMGRVPLLISGALGEPASDVAIALIQGLIAPNSVVNPERTNAMRTAAREQVPPQMLVLEQGEMIIRAGDVTKAEQAEALQEVAKLQHEWDPWLLLRALGFAAVLIGVVVVAVVRLQPQIRHDYPKMALLLIVAVIWLLVAKFMVMNHPWLPFLYPLAALAILVAVLVDLRVAPVFTLAFGIVILYLSMGNAALAAYAILGALAGALVVGRGERLNAFLWAAVVIALVNILIVIAFWAPFTGNFAAEPIQMLVVALFNGALSASIALIGYFIFSNLFDVTTPLQLTELSRPTHPLLRQLLLKASGTYHHTILVSNMAERAAAAIGADALLVRVGAYYHDIGKTVRPYFFAENILDEASPHDRLDPLTSAQIIISHVKDGLDLAQKYHLPPRIQDFIREHHGRSLVKYFYMQAARQAPAGEEIGEDAFCYPGPNPRSKETTILMLADTCEAAVRAVRPGSREELEALVDRLIDERLISGELDESALTFAELRTVQAVFLQVLQGIHHLRIVYPEAARTTAPPAPISPTNGGAGHDTGMSATCTQPGGVEEPGGRRTPASANIASQG